MDLINEKNQILNKTLEDTISEMKKENEEMKKENEDLKKDLDEWKQGYEEESMKNIIMDKEISNLRTRAVPDDYKHDYSYLVYPYEETDTHFRVRLIREQEAYLQKEHRKVVREKTFWIHEKKLPISVSLNKKFLTRILNSIPGSELLNKRKKTRIEFPKEYKSKFIDLVNYLIFIEKMN
jgi:hypothetical protein